MQIIAAVIGFVVAIGLGFIGFFGCESDWCLLTEAQRIRAADSFEECAELGFPVMESYPRQCRAGDKHFTEDVPDIDIH